MDKNSKKILNFLCKHESNHYSIISLSKEFPKIPKDHLIEIIHSLYKENYIRYVGDSSITVTNKGMTHIPVSRSIWISKNIVAILALIVSVIALIRTF